MRYRNKSNPKEIIQAFQWIGEKKEYPDWFNRAETGGSVVLHHPNSSSSYLTIKTANGWVGAGREDFIVLDTRNLSVFAPQGFHEIFERVTHDDEKTDL